METAQIWANLAVNDLSTTKTFYLAMGLEMNGKGNEDLVSFFFSKHKFVIHFFERSKIEKSTHTRFTELKTSNEVMFSLAANTEEEVFKWLNQAQNAGGIIFKEATRDEQGYFWGGFEDPDGHRFNVLLIEKGM